MSFENESQVTVTEHSLSENSSILDEEIFLNLERRDLKKRFSTIIKSDI
jgi:hypothetical protein